MDTLKYFAVPDDLRIKAAYGLGHGYNEETKPSPSRHWLKHCFRCDDRLAFDAPPLRRREKGTPCLAKSPTSRCK